MGRIVGLAGILLGTALGACGHAANPGPPPTRTIEAATTWEYSKNLQRYFAEDGIVLQTVLEDLQANYEFRKYGSFGARSQIVVWDATGGSSWYVTPGQLSSETRNGPAVTASLFEELQSRNQRPVSLKEFKPGSPRFRLEPRENQPNKERFHDAFEEQYPDASAFVGFWLPAYSAEGTTALVRFSLGPTAHGACGTYVLMKNQGDWKVNWRKLSYYA
jgi:hypothetical protein